MPRLFRARRGGLRIGSMNQAKHAPRRSAVQIRVRPAPAFFFRTRSAKRDWPALLRANRDRTRTVPLGLPCGYQGATVLKRLVEQCQPVTGLVVSVGTSVPAPRSLQLLIRTLIGPSDFAAQSGGDEFLLIYPHDQGTAAQRRLIQVVQQLWDFQLESLSMSILFSWGGIEVRNQPIGEAMVLAFEQMEETRRGRRIPRSLTAAAG